MWVESLDGVRSAESNTQSLDGRSRTLPNILQCLSISYLVYCLIACSRGPPNEGRAPLRNIIIERKTEKNGEDVEKRKTMNDVMHG